MTGGTGIDKIYGGEGADFIRGGAGNDTLYGNEGADRMLGGDGADRIRGDGGDDEILGGAGDDLIEGTGGNDSLWGEEGNDNVRGNLGDDYINGGDGDDLLSGQDGNDRLHGEAGADRLFGQNGDDLLYGEAGLDRLYGGAGNDVLDGGLDRDIMAGQDGDDLLLGQDGHDYLAGGNGNDRLYGQEGSDTLLGEAGDDYLDAGFDQVKDRLTGGTGLDEFVVLGNIGSGSKDAVNDRAGFETYNGYSGPLTALVELEGDKLNVRGMPERDVLYIHAVDGQDKFKLTANGQDMGTWSVSAISEVVINTGDGKDHIDNNNRSVIPMRVDGGGGDDVIRGGRGDDILLGGAGNDTITGRDGNDTIHGHAGNDRIYGQSGDDQLNGNTGDDIIYGREGNDTINGGMGADRLWGGTGNDYVGGNEGNDEIRGDHGDDTLRGGDGDDYLHGGSDNDRLFGDAGADELWGSSGVDAFFADDADDVRDQASNETIETEPPGTASIGDLVFIDADGDGVLDAGETGLAGAVVRLFNGIDEIASQTTDSVGRYSFGALKEGDYRVELVAESIFDYEITTAATANVSLTDGEANSTIDFGAQELPPGTASIGDLVFEDLNGSGELDAGEEGIAGAMVRLLRGSTEIANTTTGADGRYSFDELHSGEYRVELIASSIGDRVVTSAPVLDVSISTGEKTTEFDFGVREDQGKEINSLLGPGFAKRISGLALQAFGATFGGVQDVSDAVKVINVGERNLFFTPAGISFTGVEYRYGGDFPATLSSAAATDLALVAASSGGVVHVVSERATGVEQERIFATEPELPFLGNVVVRSENGELSVDSAVRYESAGNYQFEPLLAKTGSISGEFAEARVANESFGTLGIVALEALDTLLGADFSSAALSATLTSALVTDTPGFKISDVESVLRSSPATSRIYGLFVKRGGKIKFQEMVFRINSWSDGKFEVDNLEDVDRILLDPDISFSTAVDHAARQLLNLTANSQSAVNSEIKTELEQQTVDDILTGQIDISKYPNVFSFLKTDAEINSLDSVFTGILESAPVVGTQINVGQLATGRNLSFTVQGERDLTTGEKMFIAGTEGLPILGFVVKKAGGKTVARIAGTFDEAGELLPLSRKAVPEFAGGADRLPSIAYLGERKTLIHYTDEAGLEGILQSQQLFNSTGRIQARFGDGQYLTDLLPDQIGGRTLSDLTKAQRGLGELSAGQAARILFNDSRLIRKMTHFVEIDITDLPIRQGVLQNGNLRDGVQFLLNDESLDLTGRIISSGTSF